MGRIDASQIGSYRTYRPIGVSKRNLPIGSIGYSSDDEEAILKSSKQRRVYEWVERLLDKYGHEESINFYRKAAWHLSDNELVCIMEDSDKGWVTHPHRFFIYRANKKIKQRT